MFKSKRNYKEESKDLKSVHERLDDVEKRVSLLEQQRQVYDLRKK